MLDLPDFTCQHHVSAQAFQPEVDDAKVPRPNRFFFDVDICAAARRGTATHPRNRADDLLRRPREGG